MDCLSGKALPCGTEICNRYSSKYQISGPRFDPGPAEYEDKSSSHSTAIFGHIIGELVISIVDFNDTFKDCTILIAFNS